MNRTALQEIIGTCIKPQDLKVYYEAFIHKSAYKEMGYSQERLEHLGDAVLQLCITHLLFKKYPNESEGTLTKMRTKIVNGATLAQIGRRMNIENLVVVSKIANNALSHDRLYEDTFEALVGAVYLDLGLDDCMTFVAYHVENEMNSETLLCDTNYKDLLRKSISKRKMQNLRYITESNDGIFICRIFCGDLNLAEAEGTTKKRAEMEAAHNALSIHFPDDVAKRLV
jgi:ribonuclease-3